jgi:hypothetical protein
MSEDLFHRKCSMCACDMKGDEAYMTQRTIDDDQVLCDDCIKGYDHCLNGKCSRPRYKDYIFCLKCLQ